MAGQDDPYSHPDLTDCRQLGLALDSTPHPLLELDIGSIQPRHQPAFLGWPSTSSASSAEPHEFYHPYYSSARLTADQDAWNPLQVTGVPNPSPMSHMNMAVGDRDGFAKRHYRTPSESGSQYMGSFHSGDSGYGGSTSCATHSVVTSSYGVESMSSPQIGPKEQGFGESLALFSQAFVGPPVFARELVESPAESVKCDHPACSWVGKCPSDKRCVYTNSPCIFPAGSWMIRYSSQCSGNTRPDIASCSSVMSQTVLARKASVRSTIWPAIRNAFTIKSLNVGLR